MSEMEKRAGKQLPPAPSTGNPASGGNRISPRRADGVDYRPPATYFKGWKVENVMHDLTTASLVFPNDRKIRLGVWGLGRGLHLHRLFDHLNFEVVAGCDFNPHFQEHFRHRYPNGKITAEAAEFLSWDCEAVLLATYCPDHAAHAIACLQAGKHVFSEVTAFHTPAEGVALVEAVEKTGRIYQLAENYPYSLANRYLAKRWREGLFGDLQYAEYSYVHDCLNLAYTYIDGQPVEPGWTVHNWRSWLPWHYYNTHSLGPVMVIAGQRPVRVTALPGKVRLRGHLMNPEEGLSGMAPSLIEFANGGLMRNLMGSSTNDRNLNLLFGTRGASEIIDGRLFLRLGGRGESLRQEVQPALEDLDRLAATSGHGGGDFWTLYHFANQILHDVPPPFDVYKAADVTLPGLLAYRSAKEDGTPQTVPDFRRKTDRDRCRRDHLSPPRLDTENGLFAKRSDRRLTAGFSTLAVELLRAVEEAETWHAWSQTFAEASQPERILAAGRRLQSHLTAHRKTIKAAHRLAGAHPRSLGARVLRELLERLSELGLDQATFAKRLSSRLSLLRSSLLPADPTAIGERHSPQLLMRRTNLHRLPPLELPANFQLRTYREGDSEAWRTIIGESFGEARSAEDFQKAMLERPDSAPDKIYFVAAPDGVLCATAAAYGDNKRGYVHYVGLRPAYAGNKLGYWVSLAVLHDFARRGCTDCILDTDDFRVPALKTYLRLGFHPVIRHPNQPLRWRAIAARLQAPMILDEMEYAE